MNEIITNDALKSAITCATKILHNNLKDFTDHFPHSNSDNNFYKKTDNVEWTTGFCTGEYWLAYEFTNDNAFKESALKQVQSFYNRIVNQIDVNHHDMGFLYSLSCVAAYKLCKNQLAKDAAILAAEHLISRYNPNTKFIQAWGSVGAKDNFRLIIDCLLNLPLLYWATEVTKDDKYKNIAIHHTKTSLQNLIREDNSTYHTYFFDPTTFQPLYGATQQGFSDASSWARGQAWGIYGLALSYRYTKDKLCIELFKKVTDFFIEHLPKDKVPYWDLIFDDSSHEPKDSSAAAIAICGMLEMCQYLDKKQGDYYFGIANQMLKSLMDTYAVKNSKMSNGLLLHGVYAKSSPNNPIKEDRGVDECNTWGDYFYLEALMRISKDWELYW